MKRSFIFVAVALTLVLAGCSAGADGDDIRSFSEIAVADPVVELDPSGTAGDSFVAGAGFEPATFR